MIDPDHYGLIEMGFTAAVVLGFGVWQLVSVNREIAKDKLESRAAKSEDRAGHAVGEHGLNDR
jgi:hypothetical protein